MSILDSQAREAIQTEYPNEPVPYFKILPEKPFGHESFSHPKSELQTQHIDNTAKNLVDGISTSYNASSFAVVGTMGSGKSEVVEKSAEKLAELGYRIVVFTLGSQRGEGKLSRNGNSRLPEYTEFNQVIWPGDNLQNPNGFEQVVEIMRKGEVDPLKTVAYLSEASFWGHIPGVGSSEEIHARNVNRMRLMNITLETMGIYTVFDMLPQFFNGINIPLANAITTEVQVNSGQTFPMWACDTFGEGTGNIPARVTWLRSDGSFLTEDDLRGSHHLRAKSLDERKQIIANIEMAIADGHMPPFFKQQFVNGSPVPIDAIGIISNRDDAPVLLGTDTRYGSTSIANMINFSRIAGLEEQAKQYEEIRAEIEG